MSALPFSNRPENAEVVEYLLDNDADPNIQNVRLNTAVHFAYVVPQA